MSDRAEVGVIHGRFQGLHVGHMEYLLAGKERCRFLYVGITNPDPDATKRHDADPKRSSGAANPFTYFERAHMILGSLVEAGVPREEFMIVPFPINCPERIAFYAPKQAVYYMTIYDDWGRAKCELLRSLGLQVQVMWNRPPSAKPATGTEVRRRMASDENWEEHMPPAAAAYIRENHLDERVRELLAMEGIG